MPNKPNIYVCTHTYERKTRWSEGRPLSLRAKGRVSRVTVNQEGPRTDREPVYVTRKPSPYGFRRANTLVARKLGRNVSRRFLLLLLLDPPYNSGLNVASIGYDFER